MKKIWGLLICILLLALCAAGLAETAGTWGYDDGNDKGTWVLGDDGTLTVSGTGKLTFFRGFPGDASWDDVRQVVITSGITEIGDGVFENSFFDPKPNLKTVAIADTVTSIGKEAFLKCGALTDVRLPGALESVGDRAFCECTSLAEMALPDSVVSLGKSVFRGCTSLASVSLPASLDSVSDSLFSGCASLASVKLPAAVTSIGDYAFQNCGSLTAVKLPEALKSIGSCVFEGCFSLKELALPDEIEELGNRPFEPKEAEPTITLYSRIGSPTAILVSRHELEFQVKGIPMAFEYEFPMARWPDKAPTGLMLMRVLKSGTSFAVPDGVTSLHPSCLTKAQCKKLKYVELPASIDSLSVIAFSGIGRSFYLKVPKGSKAEQLARRYGLQYDNGKKKVIGWQITDLDQKVDWIIKNYITSGMSERDKAEVLHNWIVNNAYYDYGFLENGADGVLVKGKGVCDSYSKAYTLLLTKAGLANRRLTGYVNGEGHAWNLVRVDGQWYHVDATFDDACSEKSPVNSFSHYYFLASDTRMRENHTWDSSISADKNQVGDYISNGEDYWEDGTASYFLNGKTGKATVLKGKKKVKKAVIPDTIEFNQTTYKVTDVSDEAFRDCGKMTSLVIGKNVSKIGKKAFYNCSALKTVTIKTKKLADKNVGANAFGKTPKKAVYKCPSGKKGKYKTLLIKKGAHKKADYQ